LSYLADTPTDRQTNKVWQKHNLLGGGKKGSRKKTSKTSNKRGKNEKTLKTLIKNGSHNLLNFLPKT